MILCLIVTVVAALAYAFVANAKAAELARISFFCALLWLLYLVAQGRAAHLLG